MPHLRIRGTSLFYEEAGTGPAIVFSHGLLWSGRMYEAQVRALSARHRCIAYDHRGQGRSADVPGRIVTIEECYQDAVALIETLGAAPCHFVGLSMGGFVAQRIAVRRPELVRSITLLETAADPEPEKNRGSYRVMNFVARLGGIPLVANRVMKIMFGRTFLHDPAREAERRRWKGELVQNRRTIWRAVNGVIERDNFEPELSAIRVPALVLHGTEDAAISPDRARRMAKLIPNARFEEVESAGHSSTVEAPARVTEAIGRFIDEVERAPASVER